MLDRSPADIAITSHVREGVGGRRALFGALVAVTIVGMLWLTALALSPGGFGLVDALLLACFALTLPWMAVGFWNAAIGFLIARFAADPLRTVLNKNIFHITKRFAGNLITTGRRIIPFDLVGGNIISARLASVVPLANTGRDHT